MLASPYEGLSRSNIAQQSSKGSLFTSFEDVEVTAIITAIISLPGEVHSIVMSASVCLSVSIWSHNSKRPNYTKFLYMLHMTVARSSFDVRCYPLCTSGFVDDVMFAQNDLCGASCV